MVNDRVQQGEIISSDVVEKPENQLQRVGGRWGKWPRHPVDTDHREPVNADRIFPLNAVNPNGPAD